jgi:hypothetical protein
MIPKHLSQSAKLKNSTLRSELPMASSTSRKIDLSDLMEGIRNLTSARGSGFAEAGAVCLDEQGHKSGVLLHVKGISSERVEIEYPGVTEKMRKSWRDLAEAAEHGASGIAILLMRDLTNLTVVERSVKGTGFDYWLGPEETADDELIFQNMTRLEISGIRSGGNSDIARRVQDKLSQTDRTDDLGLPAYVVVVEFSKPCSQVVKK